VKGSLRFVLGGTTSKNSFLLARYPNPGIFIFYLKCSIEPGILKELLSGNNSHSRDVPIQTFEKAARFWQKGK
jgi:hypothetical protein